MSAIKDIVGLLTQLSNIIQKIQASMLAMHDENAARASEISDLKKQILALEKKYSSLEIKHPVPPKKAASEILRDEPENIDKIESASQEVLPAEKLADKVTFIKDAKDAPQEVSSVEMQDNPEFVDEKKPESREPVSAEELTDKPEVIEEEPPAPKEKTAAEILQEKYEFIKKFGIYKSKESGRYFCAACLMNNIESPLTEKLSGWQCQLKDCGQFYIKPGYKEPKRKRQTKYLQW
jgi:chemotaxis protein histidine kinase CheA